MLLPGDKLECLVAPIHGRVKKYAHNKVLEGLRKIVPHHLAKLLDVAMGVVNEVDAMQSSRTFLKPLHRCTT